jgi:exosortase E/protease (VPEID-CTERM system)
VIVRDAVSLATVGTENDVRRLPTSLPAYAAEAALALLLLAELLVLTVSFDTQPLDNIPTLWAQAISRAPQALRLTSVVLISTLALAWSRQPLHLRAVIAHQRGASRLAALLAHGCALVAFTIATGTIVSTGAAYHTHPALWTIAWLLTGAATLTAWALALWPIATWRAILRHAAGSAGWGVALGAVVFGSGFVTEEFWIPLARVTFGLVARMLGFFYSTTVSDPARLVIGTPHFRVTISPQCSGYEGVGLIVTFLSVYLWLYRKELRFPGALLLLPVGAIVIWLVNAVRIVALIAIGHAGWRAVAAGGFHSQAGWIAFNAIALGFVAITNHFGYFRNADDVELASAPVTHGSDHSEATLAYLGPFFVVTATAMLTGAVSAGIDWLYPVRVIAAGAVLWSCRRQYARLSWTCSWSAIAIGVATFALWLVLLPREASHDPTWPAAVRSADVWWAGAWMLFRVIGYVVVAPVSEELAFRGFLIRRVQSADFDQVPVGLFSWASFVVSSVLFGAFHGSLWLPGIVAGITFALALYRRRSIGDAVWAHATTNGLLALYAWATGQWWVWS